ncbi:MAG: hypothetical protein V1696_01905 [Candidatus Jorgensenbacteria bacterium]
MKKFTYAGAVFGAVVAVAFGGALLTEYVLKIGVLGTGNLKYFAIVGVVAAAIVFLASRRKALAGAAFVGCILVPYAAFLVGQIDFYMVDDNLAQGITVVEVRPTMDKIVFGTPDKGDVTVWGGPQTLVLHPGGNRVKLGRFNMPAGTYQGGSVSIGDIQVDIRADLAVMTNPVGGQSITPEYYEEAFNGIKARMTGSVGGFNISLVNSSRDGAVGTFTISVGSMTQQIPIPEIKYPGMGGPDITLDITLDEMGKPDPSKIRAIVDMPPGVSGAFPQVPGVEFR